MNTKNLVGKWKFEGNANDSSGNGNDGTVYGATLTTGKFGKCYEFDGVDDYVEVGDKDTLDMGTNDFSISGWIKTTDTSMMIASKELDTTYELYAIGVTVDGNFYFDIRDGSTRTIIKSDTSNYNNGEWIHVTASANRGGNVSLYKNGVLDGQGDISGSSGSISNDYHFIIGARWDNGDYTMPFNGSIDEVQIFNKALSPSDIKRLYHGMHPIG